MKFIASLALAMLVLAGCKNNNHASAIPGNYKDSLELCSKTAEFLHGVITSQQQTIDSIQNELNKLSSASR